MFGVEKIHNKYKNKIYSGMINEMKILYNNNISTSKITKSIKVLFNNTKLQYLTIDTNDNIIPITNMDVKLCPFCNKTRNDVFYHLGWLCSKVSRPLNLTWSFKKDFTQNVTFLEELQTKIDNLFL